MIVVQSKDYKNYQLEQSATGLGANPPLEWWLVQNKDNDQMEKRIEGK